jgi:hypothetical protein
MVIGWGSGNGIHSLGLCKWEEEKTLHKNGDEKLKNAGRIF